ncbi:MAG: mechanosensitive ion channel family protein [Ignavibacteriales bacterium]|nr:mechanosensitive ion channel family protein [Ignavibacteriales bacterium]
MNLLQTTIVGNEISRWLFALSIVTLCFVGSLLMRKMFSHRLEKHAASTITTLDDLVVTLIRRTHAFFFLVVSFAVGSYFLSLPDATTGVIRNMLFLAFLAQVVVWGNVILKYFIDHTLERYRQENAAETTTVVAFGFIGKMVFYSIMLLIALDNFGVNINTLIAGLGIGGIAIALAVQRILGDLLASLSIVLDKPYVLGDFIVVGEYLGTVEHIGLKTTRIRSLSGEQIIFSNNDLLQSRVRNFKRMYERRVVFTFSVVYETPVEKLQKISSIVRAIIESKSKTRFDRVHFHKYGESGLAYEAVYYVLDPDYNIYMDIHEAINLDLFRRFSEDGIVFSYPTRTVVLKNMDSGVKNELRKAVSAS